jgi:hypothetical protein
MGNCSAGQIRSPKIKLLKEAQLGFCTNNFKTLETNYMKR